MLPVFLTSNYPIEKHFFFIPRFVLTLIGFYPETKQTVWVRCWAFLNCALLAYGCYAEAYYGIYHISINIETALDALCPVATSIMSLVKMLCIWWYRNEFRALIERIRYLTEQQHSAKKLHYKKRLYTLATRLSVLMLFFGFWTSTSYSIRQLLNNYLRHLRGLDFVYDTPFKMMLPRPLLSLPLYPISFMLVHWHGYVTVICFVGGDGFFLGFCLYISVLLKSLQYDVRDLLKEENCGQQSEKKLCTGLSELIDRHNEISQLTQRISGIMVEITLGHFCTSSLIIGTSMIYVLLFRGYGIIVYIIYTSAVITEIFLYCLGGTYIMKTCNELADGTFGTNWHVHSVRIQKMVLLLLIRAQRVLIIKVPFFTPTLETLTSILRFTGSLIALAKSVI